MAIINPNFGNYAVTVLDGNYYSFLIRDLVNGTSQTITNVGSGSITVNGVSYNAAELTNYIHNHTLLLDWDHNNSINDTFSITTSTYSSFINGTAIVADNDGGIDTLDFSTLKASLILGILPGASTNYIGYQNISFSGFEIVNLGRGNDDVTLWEVNGGTIYGNAGNDTLRGFTGNDKLYGGDGHDILIGGVSGNDELYGGAGNDTFYGNFEKIYMDGGDGDDRVIYTSAAETYKFEFTDDHSVKITSLLSSDSVDTITNVERFYFNSKLFTFSQLEEFANAEPLPADPVTTTFSNGNQQHVFVADTYKLTALTGEDMGFSESTEAAALITRKVGKSSGAGNADYELRILTDDATHIRVDGHDNVLRYDFINNTATNVDFYAGAGNNSIQLMGTPTGITTVYAGDGNDTVSGGYGITVLYGENGNDTLYGYWGEDRLFGGVDNDTLEGGTENDYLDGGDGNDTINANHGDDIIIASAGIDRINGGESTGMYEAEAAWASNISKNRYDLDTIIYQNAVDQYTLNFQTDGTLIVTDGSGHFTHTIVNVELFQFGEFTYFYEDLRAGIHKPYLLGTPGNDTLVSPETTMDVTLMGYAGNDILRASGGNDTLLGGLGNDKLYGGLGNDILGGNEGNDELYGNEGDDVLNGDDGVDVINGGAGNDTLNGGNETDYIYGNEGNDTLNGGDGDDKLYGGNDADRIYGDDGNDYLYGEEGNDSLYAGLGIDFLVGGEGGDVIEGGDGNDTLYGDYNSIDETLYAYSGNDILVGGNGNDNIRGGRGDDTIMGNNDNDTLYGGSGDDSINGGAGDDYIYGDSGLNLADSGNDTLYGGAGVDKLYGQGGDDFLGAGEGTDYLYGGTGSNTFTAYDNNPNHDSDMAFVMDWGTGTNNKIDISDLLSGYNAGTDDLSDFAQFLVGSGHTTIQVDRDGTGGTYGWDSVLRLQNYASLPTLDVDTLESNGTLIV
jgi:Ca2+-binding RTX toxin-like protein